MPEAETAGGEAAEVAVESEQPETVDVMPEADVRRDLIAEAVADRDAEIHDSLTHYIAWKRGGGVAVAGVSWLGVVVAVVSSRPESVEEAAEIVRAQATARRADQMNLTAAGMQRIVKSSRGGGIFRIYQVWDAKQ